MRTVPREIQQHRISRRIVRGHLINNSIFIEEQIAKIGETVTMATVIDAQLLACKAAARSKYLALVLLENSDKHRYGKLIMELENDYCKSQDDYPDTITAVYNLLINYKSFKSTHFSHQDELAFFNQKTGRTRCDIKYVICHKCKKKGYYANKCPSLRDDDNKKSDITAVHVRDSEDEEQDSEYSDFSFMPIALNTSSVTSTICLNQHTGSIPKTWILLVNCSTTDIFL